MYDVVIVGGGPAGLTAGIYCARANLKTVVIDSEVFGGKITETPIVHNIPGFTEISGTDFAEKLTAQAESCGVETIVDTIESVRAIMNANTYQFVLDGLFDSYEAKAVILATGTKNRTLGLENESNLIGKGIHFCVTCDGPLYEGKNVVVIGGGNSAVTEAIELAGIASHVTVLQNLPSLTAEGSLIDKLNSFDNVNILTGVTPTEYMYLDDSITGIKWSTIEGYGQLSCDGIFLAVGLEPNTKLFENIVECDGRGFFVHSKCEGVYFCGDCSNTLQQVAIACGDGASTALGVIRYLK